MIYRFGFTSAIKVKFDGSFISEKKFAEDHLDFIINEIMDEIEEWLPHDYNYITEVELDEAYLETEEELSGHELDSLDYPMELRKSNYE